jgi:hypothetical protein
MSSTTDNVAEMAEHKNKVSRENAEAAVDEFFEYYEIDPADEEDDVRGQLMKAKRKIIKAVMAGRLEFKEETNKKGVSEMAVYQHLKKPMSNGTSTFRYGEMGGKAKTAMKGASDNDMAGKMQSLLGYLSGTSAGIIADMQGADYSLAESLSLVFLLL